MSSSNDIESRPSENRNQLKNELSNQQQSSQNPLTTINLSDGHEIPSSHNVTVNLTGNYFFSISRKGNTRLSIDKNSLSGTLVLDINTDREVKVPLTIRNFKISKNLKRIRYKANVQDENLSGKISGQLRFQNPIDTTNADDQSVVPREESFLRMKLKTPVAKIKEESNNRITISQSGHTGI
jgi:hypothetical protein